MNSCDIHQLEIILKCEQCNIPVCANCIASINHKGHSFNQLPISKIKLESPEHLEKHNEFMGKYYSPFLGSVMAIELRRKTSVKLKDIINQSKNEKTKIIKERIELYHKQLEELEMELNKQIETQYQININELDKTFKESSDEEILIKHGPLIKFCDNLVDQNFLKELDAESFLKYLEDNKSLFEKFNVDQEKNNKPFEFFDFDIKFNDNLIKENLILLSNQNLKNQTTLLYNCIVRDPYFGEKEFYISNGNPVPEHWIHDRVAMGKSLVINYTLPKAKEIYFMDGYNSYFYKNAIPNTVEAIYLGDTEFSITNESLPKGLKEIYFCDGYKHDIPKNLLVGTKCYRIHFGNVKNDFPINHMILSINGYFTFMNYKHKIPLSLNGRVYLGKIDHPIEKFPSGLSKLKFLNGFNQKINQNQFNSTNAQLHIIFESNQSYELNQNSIPENISKLEFKGGYNHSINSNYYKNLSQLRIGKVQHCLSKESLSNPTLKNLYLMNGFNHPINSDLIPSNITELTIGNVEMEPNFEDMDSIKILRFVNNFSFQSSFKTIPKNVEELCLGQLSFNLKTNNIPSTIKSISFENGFKQDFQLFLPPNIEVVKLGELGETFYNSNLSTPLPSSIKELHICLENRNTINPGFISSNVKVLVLNSYYDKIFTKNSIPKTLSKIKYYWYYTDTSYFNSFVPFTIPPIKLEPLNTITYETYGYGLKNKNK